MEAEHKCSKCSGEMEAGFLQDHDKGASTPGEWIEGVPVVSWMGYVNVRDKVHYRIEAFRCMQCGYIEQYAKQQVEQM
jgi:predicted nucleic-acid-binding Zn-ribbon protein